MHPAIRYAPGRNGRLLVNLPPYHAKTQVWTVNYCMWRMMKDPNVRIAVVSQTQQFAKKIIHQVKQMLSHAAVREAARGVHAGGRLEGRLLDEDGNLPVRRR
jgi:hypothetical protein